MKIAIISSNNYTLGDQTIKGTEIFTYAYITAIHKYAPDIELTVFASGDSRLPVPVESIGPNPSSGDPLIARYGKHIMFELALISKAFTESKDFDLFHIHIGDGDLVMPFTPFTDKPILITLHHLYNADFTRRYFSLFTNQHNVHFVSVSNAQRKILPDVRYASTIYHGLDLKVFPFDPTGGEVMMWAGRAIPQKGFAEAIDVALHQNKPLALYAIRKDEFAQWSDRVAQQQHVAKNGNLLHIHYDRERLSLIPAYQKSKLFLYPVQYEESFGLVMAEAMACGTPVVAYARGSVPEVVKDGETGFIVNESPADKRGDWIIKKTGINGLIEATELIYSLSNAQYRQMRERCRKHIEQNFSDKHMIDQYVNVYTSLSG